MLDRKTFEALAIDSRVSIMKALLARRKTQSELSKELGLAVSTVSEHLHKMNAAGLVVPVKWGKKWVYYQLTPKGTQILAPKMNAAFVFVLAVSLFMIVLGGSNILSFAPVAVIGGMASYETGGFSNEAGTAGSGPAVADSLPADNTSRATNAAGAASISSSSEEAKAVDAAPSSFTDFALKIKSGFKDQQSGSQQPQPASASLNMPSLVSLAAGLILLLVTAVALAKPKRLK